IKFQAGNASDSDAQVGDGKDGQDHGLFLKTTDGSGGGQYVHSLKITGKGGMHNHCLTEGEGRNENLFDTARAWLKLRANHFMPTYYLACDLGADSGRLMLGTLADGKISLEELHRFPNGPVKTSGALHWNIEGLLNELKIALTKAAALKLPFSSISTDSWGVDYVLYDERGLVMP